MARRFTIRFIVAALLGWLAAGIATARDPVGGDPNTKQPTPPQTKNAKADAAKKSSPDSNRKSPIVVGIETTHIVEPLGPDGYPDYLAALNDRAGHGATPQNNGAVLLWQAFGPEIVPPEIESQYATPLGVKPLPATGDYFVGSDEMVRRWVKGAPQTATGDQDDDTLPSQFIECGNQPWSADDYPMVAQWLSLNEIPLRLMAEAARRPKFYEPLIPGSRDLSSMTSIVMPLAHTMENFKAALEARAMLRLKAGQTQAAWDDLMTCHRLLAHMAAMPLVEYNQELAEAENELCQTEMKLLHLSHANAKQVQQMRDDWAALPKPISLAETIDLGRRYRFLSTICLLDRHGPETLRQMEVDTDSAVFKAVADTAFDWNEPLKLGNHWFDREMLIAQMDDRQKRDVAMELLLSDLQQMSEDSGGGLLANWFTRKSARATLSRRVVAELLERFQRDSTEFGQALDNFDQQAIHRAFVQIGFALADYRAEHGEYPERLEALVPKHIAKLPQDLYGDRAPYRYRRQTNGYKLYSVGPNGVDDSAGGSSRFAEADDITVTISDIPARTTDPDSDDPLH